jgi:hypothetical protein
MFVCVCADHSSKESYRLSISVRLRNLIRGGQGPIWAGVPVKKKKKKRLFMYALPVAEVILRRM